MVSPEINDVRINELIKVVFFMMKVLELQESVSRLQALNDDLQSRLTKNAIPDKNGDDLTGGSLWKQVRSPKRKARYG